MKIIIKGLLTKSNGFYILLFLVGGMLFLFSHSTFAAVFYLKPGQSKTVKSDEILGTIFISNPDVADYKLIGDNTVIIYAKNRGYSEFVIYGQDEKVLVTHSIEVDPIVPDLHYRIKKEFPESDIRITSFVGSGISDSSKNGAPQNTSYLLSGTVPDDLTRERIYALVGQSVGNTSNIKEEKYEFNDTANASEIFFMTNQRFSNIINRIQITQNNQVNVKLTLVEVSKQFTDSLGVAWHNLTLDSIISGGSDITSVGTFNLLGLKHGFDINNIATVIRAVQNDELAKVLAEPNLTVLSGEIAEFLVGGEIPIVTRGSNDNSSTITYKEYGIKLAVGAKVSNDIIRLFIANEFSSLSGNYSFNDYQIPTLTTRRTRSTIELKDGDSFIISGLISEQDVESLTKVPLIGDIPILGALSRSATTSRNKTELIVFATVKLVTPQSSFQDVKIPTFERTDTRNLFFNYKSNHDKQTSREFPISNESEKFLNRVGFLE